MPIIDTMLAVHIPGSTGFRDHKIMHKIVAILPVRNEGWILSASLRALLMFVDEVVVSLHNCTDNSFEITREVWKETGRVCSYPEDTQHWSEMAQRQKLLERARELGATHIVTVDADELLSGDLLPTIRQRIEALPLGVMLRLPLLNLRGCLNRVHNTGLWGSPDMNTSVAFRDEPGIHWAAQDGYQHHCREPKGRTWAIPQPTSRMSGLLHLQFVSDRRLKAKQYLYQLQDKLRWPNRAMEPYVRTVREHFSAPGIGAPAPDSWWAPYAHLAHYMDINREPWQIGECARLIREHPGIEKGLDNFGLEL